MYGTKARIGLLLPAANHVLEPEFYRLLPEGVSLHTARMLNREADLKDTAEMNKHMMEATLELSIIQPKIVVYGCTSGSFMKGVGSDLKMAKRISSVVNAPAITTSTAFIGALRELGLKKLSVATPYIDEVNLKEREFLQGHGFEVLEIRGMGIRMAFDIGLVESERVYEFAKKTFKEGSDGLFLSCTNLRTLQVIERLEKELKKPVISSNQATIWATLGMVGLKTPTEGYGELFTYTFPALK
jgi:maleate isomerase